MQKLMDQTGSSHAGHPALVSTRSVENRAAPGQIAAPGQSERRLRPQELAARLDRIRRVSRLMDAAVRVPGTRIRFGLDSVVGLVPGIGDAATAGISAWIVGEAYASGVPRRILVKMLRNIAVDFVGGAIPLAGDLFDVYWKANQRNVELLEDLLRRAQR